LLLGRGGGINFRATNLLSLTDERRISITY